MRAQRRIHADTQRTATELPVQAQHREQRPEDPPRTSPSKARRAIGQEPPLAPHVGAQDRGSAAASQLGARTLTLSIVEKPDADMLKWDFDADGNVTLSGPPGSMTPDFVK